MLFSLFGVLLLHNFNGVTMISAEFENFAFLQKSSVSCLQEDSANVGILPFLIFGVT